MKGEHLTGGVKGTEKRRPANFKLSVTCHRVFVEIFTKIIIIFIIIVIKLN